jgi:hypothetical protein
MISESKVPRTINNAIVRPSSHSQVAPAKVRTMTRETGVPVLRVMRVQSMLESLVRLLFPSFGGSIEGRYMM